MAEHFDNSLDTAAIAMHELYESFVRAGFTPDQAFQLVKVQWEVLSTP